MTGVEILSSAQVASEFAFNWDAVWICLGVMLGIGMIVGMIAWCCVREWIAILLSLISCGILGLWLGFGTADGDRIPTAYETHYKVTIDDSVSMNAFLDKYEILDQEGKIYTVKERE